MARQTRISLAILTPVCLAALALIAVHLTRSAASVETAVGTGLELRVSARTEAFVQAEPVPITVEIRNCSGGVVEVISNLEPRYGILRFRVTDPEGRTSIPEPAVQSKMERLEEMTLGLEDKLVYTALLPFGADRSVFNKVGKYTLQALYSAKGAALASEAITISVVAAHGVDAEARALFIGREQGQLASGRGTSQAAVDCFRQILREYPTSRFAPYAAYYLGLHYFRQKEYKQSIELLERVMAEYKDFPVAAEVRYRLATAYYETGRKGQAKNLLTDLIAEEPHDVFARRAERLLRELKSD